MSLESESERFRSFRLNCTEKQQGLVMDLMAEEGFKWDDVPGLPLVKVLRKGLFSLGNSLANRFGYIYIQDISSMLPPMLLEPAEGAMVLDMCASPGSKTGQLAMSVGPTGLVVANEPNPARLATLRANLKRMNLLNVITSGYQGQDFPETGAGFDCILLDVPCSGWGTVNKNPGVLKLWTQDKLSSLISLQRMLIRAGEKLLRPGGRMVYSTCTTNVHENEEQVEWAVKTLPLEVEKRDSLFFQFDIGLEFDLHSSAMIRVRGSGIGGQDFFMTSMVKSAGSSESLPDYPKKQAVLKPVAFEKDMRQFDWGSLWDFSGSVFFVPEAAWEYIGKGMNAHGTRVGKFRKEMLHLAPDMRVFLQEKPGAHDFNVTDLEVVKKLLSGQSLFFSSNRKLVGLYWRGMGLGWLKVKGNRIFWSDR